MLHEVKALARQLKSLSPDRLRTKVYMSAPVRVALPMTRNLGSTPRR